MRSRLSPTVRMAVVYSERSASGPTNLTQTTSSPTVAGTWRRPVRERPTAVTSRSTSQSCTATVLMSTPGMVRQKMLSDVRWCRLRDSSRGG